MRASVSLGLCSNQMTWPLLSTAGHSFYHASRDSPEMILIGREKFSLGRPFLLHPEKRSKTCDISKASMAFVTFSNIITLYLIMGQQQAPLLFRIRHRVNIWKLFMFNHLGKLLFTAKTGNGIILWFLPKAIFLFLFILTCMERVSCLIITPHKMLRLVFKRNEELYKELICFSKLWFFFEEAIKV